MPPRLASLLARLGIRVVLPGHPAHRRPIPPAYGYVGHPLAPGGTGYLDAWVCWRRPLDRAVRAWVWRFKVDEWLHERGVLYGIPEGGYLADLRMELRPWRWAAHRQRHYDAYVRPWLPTGEVAA